MVRKCSVNDCKNVQDTTNGITMHLFPKDPTLRRSWVSAMKREGFQPKKSSHVCSVHFKADDFERSSKNRVHTYLKKHAVPSVFITPEKKRNVLQIVNPTLLNVQPKLPPVCIGDDKPCCEREAWQNMPIVSSMCRKCAVSCGTKESKKVHQQAWKSPCEG